MILKIRSVKYNRKCGFALFRMRIYALLRGACFNIYDSQTAFVVANGSHEFDSNHHSYSSHVLTISGWQILQPVSGSLVSELTLAVAVDRRDGGNPLTSDRSLRYVHRRSDGYAVTVTPDLSRGLLACRWIMHRVDVSSRSDVVGIAGNLIRTPRAGSAWKE